MDNILERPLKIDPAKVSNNNIALHYGAIWAGIAALSSLVGFLTNTDPSLYTTGIVAKSAHYIFGFSVMIWAIATAIKADRTQLGGKMRIGRATVLGLKMGLIYGLLIGIYIILFMTVINPDYLDTIKAGLMTQYTDRGMSEEQAEAAINMAGMFMSPGFFFGTSVITGLLSGLIVGLISGAVLKRD
jgi:Protein of unknown function (DUF4199)